MTNKKKGVGWSFSILVCLLYNISHTHVQTCVFVSLSERIIFKRRHTNMMTVSWYVFDPNCFYFKMVDLYTTPLFVKSSTFEMTNVAFTGHIWNFELTHCRFKRESNQRICIHRRVCNTKDIEWFKNILINRYNSIQLSKYYKQSRWIYSLKTWP